MTNNPPAFPREFTNAEVDSPESSGMTLRDYFAAKAMQSYLIEELPRQLVDKEDDKDFLPRVAYIAYKMADAMLKERESRRGDE